MSLKQKCLVFFFLFWMSFFIEAFAFKCMFVVFFAFVLKKDIPLILFAILFLIIIITHDKPVVYQTRLNKICGEVVQVKEGYALIKSHNTQMAVFLEHSFSYFDHVCVEGTFKKHITSSNFFKNPIETWISVNNHLGSLNDVQVLSHVPSNSLKGKLHDKANTYPDNHVLMGMLFDYSLIENSLFSGLILSSGLQYAYVLHLLRKLCSKVLYKHHIAIILSILWLFFGLFWGFNYIWYRIFLCNVFVSFFKNRMLILPLSYTVLLIMFPNMSNHIAFVFPMLFQLFIFTNNLSRVQRFTIILILQHVYLYSSNLLMIVFFSIFRQVSGLLYILSWMALLFTDFYVMYQRITQLVFSIPTFPSSLLFGKLFFSVACGIGFMIASKTFNSIKVRCMGYLLLMVCLLGAMFPIYDLVLFVNVGQADATIIRKSFNRGSLIIDSAKESDHVVLSQTLKGLGLMSLDAILISHDDKDHSGGFVKLHQLFPNANVVQEKQDIEVKQLYFQSLINEYVGLDKNDNSILGTIHIGQLRYLFLGDLHKTGEQYLVKEYPNLKIDVVKLAHHGSKTSTSNDLIATIQPQFAIISAQKSVYGHPHDSVLKTLYQYQVMPLDTNTYGDIAFISLFDWQFVLTSSGLFGIIK